LRAPEQSAKHKIIKLAAVCALIGRSNGEKRRQETQHRAVDLAAQADEENFSFVNDSPRRLLSRGAGIEGARRASWSFAPTVCV
jgi:hypothetical protein